MMKSSLLASFAAALLCAPRMSMAQPHPDPDASPQDSPAPEAGPAAPSSDNAEPAVRDPSVEPAQPADAMPPRPVAQPPAPPRVPPPVPVRPAPPPGQWVYTQQYGWLWMPYGEQYVHADDPMQPNETVYPTEYVYLPLSGWTWLAAPWIWGWGPELYFGVGGAGHFAWYHPRGAVGHGAAVVHGGLGAGHLSGGHFGGGHFGGGHFGGGGHGGGHR